MVDLFNHNQPLIYCFNELKSVQFKLLFMFMVFLLFGMVGPLTAKLTPQLLEALVPEGIQIIMAEPTALDSRAQFYKNVLAGFFILFQSSSLSTGFGVGFDAVLLVLLGFMLAVGVLQILTLLIYSLTNGKPRRKLAVRMLAVAAFLPLLVYTCVQIVGTGDLLMALENTLRSPLADWTPVADWASAGVVSLIAGDMGNGFLFLKQEVRTHRSG
jgi:hypothetical protein